MKGRSKNNSKNKHENIVNKWDVGKIIFMIGCIFKKNSLGGRGFFPFMRIFRVNIFEFQLKKLETS